MAKKKSEKYVIVRSYAMGVFAGILDPKSTETLKILTNARRIWYWSGAASLSQLAMEGTSDPANCKFPCPVDRVELSSPQGFEVLDVTSKGRTSIESVPVWRR
jgi:hypothetical protein